MEPGDAVSLFAVYDRVGASMRRAPYVWLSATLLLILLMNSALRRALIDEEKESSIVAIVAAASSAYSVVVWAMWPGLMARAKKRVPTERTVVVRWMFASMPFWSGFVAVILGGQRWCYGVGLIASVVLVVLTVRWIRTLPT